MINNEKQIQLKENLLQACIIKQSFLINDFEKRLEAIKNDEVIDGNESYDQKDLALKSQQDDEQALLSKEMRFAKEEMATLQSLRSDVRTAHSQAELGAVVLTDQTRFYICVSIEQFQADGDSYVGLSVRSPLFQKMQGKKTGERFTWRKKKYKIIAIF
jgi:transcription elongation GreA/GreB family factor